MQRRHLLQLLLVALLAWVPARLSHAQVPPGFRPAGFTPGSWSRLEDLPEGPFRERLESLPETGRARAVEWLRRLHFTAADLGSMRADDSGGIYFADPSPPPPPTDPASSTAGSTSTASTGSTVPVNPFPGSLVFHSRPGAPNVLFLNFAGENVTGTLWNSSLGRNLIPALPFSSDSDTTTFSSAEQAAIRRIWQRVAEDFAPFQVDVTTERPGTFNNRTAHVVVTRNTDADGQPNPASTSGGVAYVDVFGRNGYASYRPAWVYANNLGNAESYIAEAASHEAGHNLGLGHDGILDGPEYYSGHGSGEISWGPIMGTPYGRNVTQWSRGDYRQANNPQDDLALIAAKIAYLADDHGNTTGTATPLVIAPDGRVVSTTPADDPDGTDPDNRGMLERNSDVDVFSLVTGAGRVVLEVQPWRMADTLTRGGNADLAIELRDAAGRMVGGSDPADRTTARIETDVSEGVYHLHIRGAGTGDPLAAQPTGYPAYGSLGQYFLSGQLVPTGFSVPPVAELQAETLAQNGLAEWEFVVTYSDDGAVDVGTLDDGDLRVTGPRGYDRPARLKGFTPSGNGSPRTATYAAPAPDGAAWTGADNGPYSVALQPEQVADTAGTAAAAGSLGGFEVAIPTAVYAASLDADPGWVLEGRWQYGAPSYSGVGPTRGRTGDRILAYNLSGNYENRLSSTWATTQPIDATGAAALTLRFQRWLRLRNADTATVQVSTNGTDWSDLWRTRSAVADTAWREVQLALPDWTDGSPSLFLRWGLASGPAQNDIGWNLDDIEILSGSTLDTTPPMAVLGASDVTLAGAPTHTFTVTYSDDTAVAVATIGPEDLQVLAPDGGLMPVTLEGVDPAGDGTPRTATYSVSAPGGDWDPTDNGVYQVTLLEGEVEDIANNAVGGGVVGSFTAAMAGDPVFRELTVTIHPPDWGTVTPSGGRFPDGNRVELHATPATYHQFARWTGAGGGSTANPLPLTLTEDTVVGAEFSEILTTNRPTPLWWLAAAGVDGDFESAVEQVGANGFALWESYIAGLDPNDPESRLALDIGPDAAPGSVVLQWTPVEGRRYTVLGASDPAGPFLPLEGAVDLPPTEGRLIMPTAGEATPRLYRLQVVKP